MTGSLTQLTGALDTWGALILYRGCCGKEATPAWSQFGIMYRWEEVGHRSSEEELSCGSSEEVGYGSIIRDHFVYVTSQ